MAERYVSYVDFDQYVRSETNVDLALKHQCLDAAVIAVDNALKRRVEQTASDAVATARTYRPEGRYVFLDDLSELESVVENGVTLTAGTDFVLEPLNGRSQSGEERPYDCAIRYDRCWYADWPKPTITVTAKWGWPSIPAPIVEMCKIIGKAYVDTRNTSLGIAALTESGAVSARDVKLVTDTIREYRAVRSIGIA